PHLRRRAPRLEIGARLAGHHRSRRFTNSSLRTATLPSPPARPVTAKLSRKFYETFGDEIANELVNWFNDVDATYRGDLRELNELNFARFDAKLEQRLAELKAELRAEIQAVRADLVKWMFVFWAPTALAVVGLLLRRQFPIRLPPTLPCRRFLAAPAAALGAAALGDGFLVAPAAIE